MNEKTKLVIGALLVAVLPLVCYLDKRGQEESAEEVQTSKPVTEYDQRQQAREIEKKAADLSEKVKGVLNSFWDYDRDCDAEGKVRLGDLFKKHYTFSITAVSFKTSPDGIVAFCDPSSNCIKMVPEYNEPGEMISSVVIYGGSDDTVLSLLERYKEAVRLHLAN